MHICLMFRKYSKGHKRMQIDILISIIEIRLYGIYTCKCVYAMLFGNLKKNRIMVEHTFQFIIPNIGKYRQFWGHLGK